MAAAPTADPANSLALFTSSDGGGQLLGHAITLGRLVGQDQGFREQWLQALQRLAAWSQQCGQPLAASLPLLLRSDEGRRLLGHARVLAEVRRKPRGTQQQQQIMQEAERVVFEQLDREVEQQMHLAAGSAPADDDCRWLPPLDMPGVKETLQLPQPQDMDGLQAGAAAAAAGSALPYVDDASPEAMLPAQAADVRTFQDQQPRATSSCASAAEAVHQQQQHQQQSSGAGAGSMLPLTPVAAAAPFSRSKRVRDVGGSRSSGDVQHDSNITAHVQMVMSVLDAPVTDIDAELAWLKLQLRQ